MLGHELTLSTESLFLFLFLTQTSHCLRCFLCILQPFVDIGSSHVHNPAAPNNPRERECLQQLPAAVRRLSTGTAPCHKNGGFSTPQRMTMVNQEVCRPVPLYQISNQLMTSGQQRSVNGCGSAGACGDCQGRQSSRLSGHSLDFICKSQAPLWLVSCLQKRGCLLLITPCVSLNHLQQHTGCRGDGIHLWSHSSEG